MLPPDAVLLASSPTCPVQMFRVRENLYATQFHPELDLPGIITRIGVYRDYGYFQPKEHDDVVARVRRRRRVGATAHPQGVRAPLPPGLDARLNT